MAIIQIVDIVKNLVSQLGCVITLTSNVDNGGGNHVLTMANTYFLTKLKVFESGGNTYKVTDFVFNQSITIEPVGHTAPLTETTITLPAPLFFHGTVKSTDKEVIKAMQDCDNSYPIVYLFENIQETFISDKLNPLERTSTIQLFILDIANYADNLNTDFLEDVLKPLSNVECKLFEVLAKEKGIAKITADYSRTNLARFARTSIDGETDLIFCAELSGIELNLTLPIKKC